MHTTHSSGVACSTMMWWPPVVLELSEQAASNAALSLWPMDLNHPVQVHAAAGLLRFSCRAAMQHHNQRPVSHLRAGRHGGERKP